jgi:hypothetical protein
MWRTLVTGEFVSKDVAADWAVARLPAIQAAVLADAREIYLRGRGRGLAYSPARTSTHGQLTARLCDDEFIPNYKPADFTFAERLEVERIMAQREKK